jgi:hypothetical protein
VTGGYGGLVGINQAAGYKKARHISAGPGRLFFLPQSILLVHALSHIAFRAVPLVWLASPPPLFLRPHNQYGHLPWVYRGRLIRSYTLCFCASKHCTVSLIISFLPGLAAGLGVISVRFAALRQVCQDQDGQEQDGEDD